MNSTLTNAKDEKNAIITAMKISSPLRNASKTLMSDFTLTKMNIRDFTTTENPQILQIFFSFLTIYLITTIMRSWALRRTDRCESILAFLIVLQALIPRL